MTEENTAYQIGYYSGILFGAFICGAVVGLLPLFVARRGGHRTFGFVSWVVCVVGSLIMGVFLSVPAAIVLTVVALCLKKELPGGAGLAPNAPVRMINAQEQTASAEYGGSQESQQSSVRSQG